MGTMIHRDDDMNALAIGYSGINRLKRLKYAR